MKTRLSFIILLLFCTIFTEISLVMAKKRMASNSIIIEKENKMVYTYSVYGEIPTAKAVFEEEHFLGAKLAEKWNTFTTNYTRTYTICIGFTDSAVELIKPAVYNAVQKLNRHYRKIHKKGIVTTEQAILELSHVFDCANIICFEDDTKNIENELAKANTPEQILAVFNRIELVRK